MLRRIGRALALSSVEAFLAILCLFAGIPILVEPDHLAPGSILATLPFFMVYVWGGGLVLGGTFTLVGITGMWYRLEQAGVAILGGISFIYMFAIYGVNGASAFLPMLTYLLFGIAMLARYFVLDKVTYAVEKAKEVQRDRGDIL